MIRKLLAILCGLAALGLLLLLVFNPLDGREHADLLRFIGRFHPLVLHLPIGLLLLLALLEVLSVFKGFSYLRLSVPLVLTMTILGCLSAVGTGFLLAYGSGSDEALVVTHMQTAVSLTLGVLALGVAKLFEFRPGMKVLYRILLAVNLVLLTAASHYGGSITHGEDYLTRYMPNPIRPFFGLKRVESRIIASSDELVLYEDLVRPILEENCSSCHNANKFEGKLNLETYEGLLAGGESGAVLAAGDRERSELFRRIGLSPSDDDFMPAEGKPPLTEEEIGFIGWWIDQGAPAEDRVAAYAEIPPGIETYIQEAFDGMVSEEERARLEEERRQLYGELEELARSLNVLIIPSEPRSRRFRLETFASQNDFDDEKLLRLEPYASYFVSADLSGTRVTDESIEILAGFENLRSLNLSRTQISGRGLEQLARLRDLESLNLYGTALRRDYLEELFQLTQLERLFLVQTDLYQEAILEQLKAALPNCQIPDQG